jgi:hypothetical protein
MGPRGLCPSQHYREGEEDRKGEGREEGRERERAPWELLKDCFFFRESEV